mmetsp:Transcript_4868/g.13512  ORF Transcript_4868/g.13512 Transcript_4868/m.13512 type:complete len:153 (-) Transcript_4868:225-683(-)
MAALRATFTESAELGVQASRGVLLPSSLVKIAALGNSASYSEEPTKRCPPLWRTSVGAKEGPGRMDSRVVKGRAKARAAEVGEPNGEFDSPNELLYALVQHTTCFLRCSFFCFPLSTSVRFGSLCFRLRARILLAQTILSCMFQEFVITLER